MEAWIETGPERIAIYEAMLPRLRDRAWMLGYTLAVHGTMRRDFDLIAVPWIEAAAPAEMLIEALCEEAPGRLLGRGPSEKPNGRRAWSIHLDLCIHLYLDVSVMPRV